VIRARDAKKLSHISRIERYKALISEADQGLFFVFTFKRVRAMFSDETKGFSHFSILGFKIPPEHANLSLK